MNKAAFSLFGEGDIFLRGVNTSFDRLRTGSLRYPVKRKGENESIGR
jgi:hypothetical protein